MPALNRIARIAVMPFPRKVDAKSHAVLDYITVGILLTGAASFWKRNKRAAVGALAVGGAALAVNLLTDYPGGVKKAIKFRTHRHVDFGLAALAAAMPEFLAFDDEHERKLFLVEGALISAINELTHFPPQSGRAEKKAA